jgi:predicted DNA-binding transcriptional regulator YafY
VPEHLCVVLAKAQQIIGFERMPVDIFHAERASPEQAAGPTLQRAAQDESMVVSEFLQAIFDRRSVALDYRSPYAARAAHLIVMPQGLLWDRDHWYLAGNQADRDDETRLWRADRVLAIKPDAPAPSADLTFDVNTLLGHTWLQSAMKRWIQESPVVIRLARRQAERLKQDWYYRHAHFMDLSDDQIIMTFGEGDRSVVLDLLRWLGPGAELIAPVGWRAAIRAELAEMLQVYTDDEGAA